jgi:DNA-binding transcriptional ArsR family regulator
MVARSASIRLERAADRPNAGALREGGFALTAPGVPEVPEHRRVRDLLSDPAPTAGERRRRFLLLSPYFAVNCRAANPALTEASVSHSLPFVATYGVAELATLADPSRRAIFEALREGPKAVGELAKDLPISRPAVSQHLKVLKEAGLVTDQAAGTRRLYRIRPEGIAALRAYLDRMWDEALAAFAAAAEREESEDQG